MLPARRVFRKQRGSVEGKVGGRMDVSKELVGGLTFGIIICNDSNYFEPARIMASTILTGL